jgi:hypothetical protein
VWTGARYSDVGSGKYLTIETLDASLVCPVVPGAGLLGDSTPMSEGTRAPFPKDSTNVTGVAVNLMNNLMPISGYAQWYPFGTGDQYHKEDEASRFRFQLHESSQ